MAALALPPKDSTSRELMRQARLVERLSVQRREQLKRLAELEHSIREAKRIFRQLAELLGAPLPDALPPGEPRCDELR